MKITFVRHGRTHLNVAGKANGQDMADSLTDEGIEQAEQAALDISKDYTEIYSSDLVRARETADIINKKLNLTIKYDARLRERNMGSFTGLSWNEMGSDVKLIDKSQKYDYRAQGGESVEDVKERLYDFIEDILINKKDEKVLVVTHGGIIRLLHFLLKDEVLEKIHNASIHEFEF